MSITIITSITLLVSLVTAFTLLLRSHGRFPHIALAISLIATAAVIFGDTMSVLNPDIVNIWKRSVFICEVVMAFFWLLFTLSFARVNYLKSINWFSKLLIFLSPVLLVYFTVIPVEDIFYSPEFETEKILFLENAGYVFNLLILLYSIVSIINIETTLRNSSGTDRWQIKYILIGAGGILAINILYYSHALLYRSIDMTLLPVRTGIILISILLIIFSLLRHKVLNVEVRVSRKIVYSSLSLFIIGFYLVGLGIIGEGMRYFGPQVGKNITTFIGFVGAILIVVTIMSEQIRRKTIVFINKHFFRQKYDYREQWLKFTQQISLKHSFEDLLEAIAEGFKDAIGSRRVTIWLKGKDNGYECVKALDTYIIDMKPQKTLINFLSEKRWILDVSNSNCKEIVNDNIEFINSTRASLIVPLFNIEELIGFVILGEGLAGEDYNYEDYDLLKTLARQAAAAILNAKLSEELTEAKEMEVMGKVSSFIIHDLKNATTMLSLVAQNAEEHIGNPEFQRDAIKTIVNTSDKIKDIIEKLKNLPSKMELNLQDHDLGECVEKAIMELRLNGNANFSYKKLAPVRVKVDREEISKVIINLIVNAIDATDKNGNIKVVVGAENNMAYVKVSDTGCGMSEEFIRKHLFKPFHTTKKKGLGIGLFQCKAIVEAHAGKLKVISKEGKGSDFILYLPLSQQ
jgi:hypothetical protein